MKSADGKPSAGEAVMPSAASAAPASAAVHRRWLTLTQRGVGSLSASRSASAVASPSSRRQTRTSHSGCDVRRATADGASPWVRAARCAPPSADTRRSTALTKPPARRLRLFASSTESLTTACAGTRSRKRSWKAPSRNAVRTAASTRDSFRPAVNPVSTASRVLRRLTVPETSSEARARSRASSPARSDLAAEARSRRPGARSARKSTA
jgi:hypothetical protein